jgi:3-oxoadipate enol-lactonase
MRSTERNGVSRQSSLHHGRYSIHPKGMIEESKNAGLNWIQTSTHHAETVVLIHAVGQDLTYWDRQIEALSPSYNVVAFDLPGHGLSAVSSADRSFAFAADLVAELIGKVSASPVHLVGISFGGMIAQVTAITRPEMMRSLTLIGTAPSFPDEVRQGMRARANLVRSQGMAAVVESSLQRWFTQSTRERRPDITNRLTKTLLGDDASTHAAIWDIISALNLDNSLSDITCPTLVLVGEQDPSTPPAVASRLASAIKGSSLVIIPEASHIVTVEAPGLVNTALLSFLAGPGS